METHFLIRGQYQYYCYLKVHETFSLILVSYNRLVNIITDILDGTGRNKDNNKYLFPIISSTTLR